MMFNKVEVPSPYFEAELTPRQSVALKAYGYAHEAMQQAAQESYIVIMSDYDQAAPAGFDDHFDDSFTPEDRADLLNAGELTASSEDAEGFLNASLQLMTVPSDLPPQSESVPGSFPNLMPHERASLFRVARLFAVTV